MWSSLSEYCSSFLIFFAKLSIAVLYYSNIKTKPHEHTYRIIGGTCEKVTCARLWSAAVGKPSSIAKAEYVMVKIRQWCIRVIRKQDAADGV